MLEYIFDLPLIITGLAIIGLLCLYTVIGLRFVRNRVLPRLHIEGHDSHFSAVMVHSVMVFYGLAAALIAVNVSETYSEVSKIVSGEATALAVVYRDVSSYPEPIRTELQKGLQDYTQYIIKDAWPLQRHGKIPGGGVQIMNHFQSTLVSFEPLTEGQKFLHGETLNAYNQVIQARRLRLDAVNTGLPLVMWIIVILGAFIGLTTSFFFQVEDVRYHLILVLLLAVLIGLIIFVILSLDRPFCGDLGLSSEPYQLIFDQLMKGGS